MPEYDKLLQIKLPEALESAIDGIDRSYDLPKQLLDADVSEFEELDCCVFAYFDRDDIFYLNQEGRKLLDMRRSSLDERGRSSPPIFWLEDDAALRAADDFATRRQQPVQGARELVTLSWGKTWLHGTKYPIRSLQGQTIAILFAGYEIPPSRQIKLVAEHYRDTQFGIGEN
ncbi:hypothetical protein [Pelagicoccus albus]|uniref:PAS domain-containing protein n=1 Tax=Pelagicoccus albus TaxID=415222 RepID=A0A7X1B7E3_9BACT|nr:hypothetical protein [Pelagicoccus albus]MBC2606917.1 hypothetical protein [Pelagicoccus albus]